MKHFNCIRYLNTGFKKYNKIFIFTISFIPILIFSEIIFGCSGKGYNIDDYFSDSTAQGKVVFMFINVNRLDSAFLQSTAKEVFKSHPMLQIPKDSSLVVLVAQFYRMSEAIPVPDSMKKVLKRDYPHSTDLDKRLFFVPDAYVYTGFSRKILDLELPQNSLFKTAVFIPKPGIKAIDVLKRHRNGNDSTIKPAIFYDKNEGIQLKGYSND